MENGSEAGLSVIPMQSELEWFSMIEGNGEEQITSMAPCYFIRMNLLGAKARFWFRWRKATRWRKPIAHVLNLPVVLSPRVSQRVVATALP